MDVGFNWIDELHKKKGWNGCGYHVVIRRNGTIEHGRPFNLKGAHVKGYNSKSYGICLVGGVDEFNNPQNNFTVAQWDSLEIVVAGLKQRAKRLFDASPIVLGHRDFPNVNKACPCFSVAGWRQEMNI